MTSIRERPHLKSIRCAIYTRVSTDQGLDQEFNSLDAQREASEAYIKSQAHEGWTCLKDHYDDGGFSGGSMERPALQRLLEDVRGKKLDVIVVYKVDRLTRSLADFAKLVELFDAHNVSFVSVTQSFNTTSSMGRLTLNVLLSFAQFEREVTGERIRDKIAASKKKGLWMGGVVPHGYRVENRKLVVDEQEAKEVRLIFERYVELKSLPVLVEELEGRGIRTRVRKLTSGKEVGGIPFMTGPLSYILGNRVYLGETNHQGKSYSGEHDAIIHAGLFDEVQVIKALGAVAIRRNITRSDALLAGLIFDDRGNHMTPVHSTKGNVRYRYYQSWVLAHGQKHKVGSVYRVSAGGIEDLVSDAVARHFGKEGIPHDDLRAMVRRIVVHAEKVDIELDVQSLSAATSNNEQPVTCITVPWTKPLAVRKKQILGPNINQDTKPIRSKARTRVLKGIAQGRVWLNQLLEKEIQDITELAARHSVSEKTVRSTLNLAFLAPDIVETVIAGRLPRGLGISQMTDLPCDWELQRKQLGIA